MQRHDYRSRRRSFSGGLLENTPTPPRQHRDKDTRYDSSSQYPRTPPAPPRSRRDSSQGGPRPTLPPSTTKQPNATPNHRDSKRVRDERPEFHVAYEQPIGAHPMPAPGYPGGTPYHHPGLSLPAGFFHGVASTRSSTYYSSPGSQSDGRPLPDRDHHRRSQPSIKDIKTVRALQSPRIIWNIAFPFSSASFDSSSRISLSELDQFATKPSGIDRFVIKFEDSKSQRLVRSFWRSIKISGSRPIEHGGSTVFVVTVRDVLNAVFDFFQIPLSRDEYASLSNDEAQMVLKAQRKRMGRHAYGFGEPLRVDLLGEYLRFEGVQFSSLKDGRIYFSLDLSRW